MAEAAAITSAKRPLSLAFIPNAVKPSVTISEVLARSAPEAAAKFIIPSIPEVISWVFQPAIAIYSIALAASVAENAVVAPICLALLSSAVKSAPVAPDIEATEDIAASKLEPTFMDAAAAPATAVPAAATPAATPFVTAVIPFPSPLKTADPADFARLPIFDNPECKAESDVLATFCRAVFNPSTPLLPSVALSLMLLKLFTIPEILIAANCFILEVKFFTPLTTPVTLIFPIFLSAFTKPTTPVRPSWIVDLNSRKLDTRLVIFCWATLFTVERNCVADCLASWKEDTSPLSFWEAIIFRVPGNCLRFWVPASNWSIAAFQRFVLSVVCWIGDWAAWAALPTSATVSAISLTPSTAFPIWLPIASAMLPAPCSSVPRFPAAVAVAVTAVALEAMAEVMPVT